MKKARKGEKANLKNRIAEEVYDYKTDAAETENLANEKVYSETRKELSNKLMAFLKN